MSVRVVCSQMRAWICRYILRYSVECNLPIYVMTLKLVYKWLINERGKSYMRFIADFPRNIFIETQSHGTFTLNCDGLCQVSCIEGGIFRENYYMQIP